MGEYSLCRDTLKLLCHYSEQVNGNGRIVHEILPQGYCPNPGNTQETAHFITMVWKYYEFTGDWSLVEECLPYMRKSIEWLIGMDDDGDMFPSGYGIIEIAGLNMELIDTAVYTCEAYECFGKILEITGENEAADRYFGMYAELKDRINTLLWDERAGLYCDAYASYDTINSKRDVLEGLIEFSASEEIRNYIRTLLEERKEDGSRERGWLLNRNWVINTPMEIGIAEQDKAIRALKRMEKDDFIGKYGMYLDALTQKQMMTISTGVMAVAQAMYGRSDEALRLLKKIFDTFSMATPGSISEMSPDYGCFVQAWTVYGVMLTVVRFFFGIEPMASKQKIALNPCMPSEWDCADISDVRALDGSISVKYKRTAEGIELHVVNTSSYPVEIKGQLYTEKNFITQY